MKWSLLFIRALFVAILSFSFATSAVAQGTQIQGPRDAADVYSGVVYGPIDQSDTLWAISNQYRKNQQFTVYQVMLAIYELNPRAFTNRNFNTMVSGSMLQLPTDRYIARVDPQRARAKAEQDDRAFSRSTGRQGRSTVDSAQASPEVSNLKPDVPLVNKEELDATEKQFQQQINSLRRQQATTVNEFKQQLGQSIQATQIIVDENKVVLQELSKKNEEIEALKTELTDDFQSKLDAQAKQIEELKRFVALAQLKEQQDQENSFLSVISDPLFIIIASTVAFFLVFVLIAMLLLRKPSENEPAVETPEEETENILLDDPASNDADELLAMLESEDLSDDDLLDDILSDELEESIDEVGVDTDDFGELDDEMLVPDQKDKQASDDLDDALIAVDDDISLDADDVDVDLDSIDLGDDDIDLGDDDSIDLGSSDASLLDSDDDFDVLDNEPEEVDIDSILDEQNVDISQVSADASMQLDNDDDSLPDDSLPENLTESALSEDTDDEDEQSEISIDDLLEQNALDSDTPDGISLDASGEIDENIIEQIEAEISERNTEINTLGDSFKEELESNDFDEDDFDINDFDEDADLSGSDAKKPEQQKSIQPLDDITKGLEDDIADAIASAEQETVEELAENDIDDPLTDELLNELGAELPEDDIDLDVEELLSEPLTPPSEEIADDEMDIDSVLEDSLNELQTGTIDFEQSEELADAHEASLQAESDDDLSVEDVLLSEALVSDEPEDIDIDSVLDDSLDDLINNQLDDGDSDLALDSDLDSDFLLDETENDTETEVEPSKETEPEIDHESEIDFEPVVNDEMPDASAESDTDPNIIDVEGSPDLHAELDDVSDDMLTELDSTEALDEIELDDIDLGDLAALDSVDLPSVDSEPLEQATPDNLALDDIPSFAEELSDTQPEEPSIASDISDAETSDTLVSESTDEADDGLLDLPDLDDWLDDDEPSATSDNVLADELDKYSENESEDDVLREIEEADFDSLLEEMGALSDDDTAAEIDKLAIDDVAINESEDGTLASTIGELDSDSLDNPDLDLTALFDESADKDANDFIDVDSLLQESENLTPATDDELALDLEMSLDNFLNDEAEVDVDLDADQASNLDLARVYIDMEDHEAAIEALEDVLQKGTTEQKEEAQELLTQLKG